MRAARVLLLLLAAAAPRVEGAWVRASLPHQDATAAYFTIVSPVDDTLLSVSSPGAGMAMLHAATTKNGMSGMQDVDNVPLRAGMPMVFAPRGRHVMLMDLQHALRAGDTLRLTLHFAKGGNVSVDAPVRTTAP